MNTTELLEYHKTMTDEARELMARKNHDYAGEKEDTFANFKMCDHLGLCPASTGVLVRISDKLTRLASLTGREAKVNDEAVHDTCVDIINYIVIYSALLGKENPPKKIMKDSEPFQMYRVPTTQPNGYDVDADVYFQVDGTYPRHSDGMTPPIHVAHEPDVFHEIEETEY